MRYLLTINGQPHTLELERGETLLGRMDGEVFAADAVQIAPGVFSLLIGGRSFAARLAAESPAGYVVEVDGNACTVAVQDPRQWRRGNGPLVREGRRHLAAPMPGKVVRLLVAPGRRVEAGQGLIVVEAMKMQNEIRSPAAGTVEAVLVAEGQAVAAGESLLIIG